MKKEGKLVTTMASYALQTPPWVASHTQAAWVKISRKKIKDTFFHHFVLEHEHAQSMLRMVSMKISWNSDVVLNNLNPTNALPNWGNGGMPLNLSIGIISITDHKNKTSMLPTKLKNKMEDKQNGRRP